METNKKLKLRLSYEFIHEDGEKCRPNINFLNCINIPIVVNHENVKDINFNHGHEVRGYLIDAFKGLLQSPETSHLFEKILDKDVKDIDDNLIYKQISNYLSHYWTNCEISIQDDSQIYPNIKPDELLKLDNLFCTDLKKVKNPDSL